VSAAAFRRKSSGPCAAVNPLLLAVALAGAIAGSG
jgi:hypothetical protein